MTYRNDDEFGGPFLETDRATTALLARWRRNCLRSQIANYDAATWFHTLNYLLGVPAALLAALVASSVLLALDDAPPAWALLLAGIASFFVSFLTALQTFLRLGERASRHRAIAADYGDIKRNIDLVLTRSENSIPDEDVEMIRRRMGRLASDAPVMPNRFWHAVHKKVPPNDDSAITDEIDP